MQTIKDSFYLALRGRLTALDPSLTVSLNGVTRPAILVTENETSSAALPMPDAFYITWLAAGLAKGNEQECPPLIEIACRIDYWTEGTSANSYQDRGRALSSLDENLLAICSPAKTPLTDQLQSPPAVLGANVFWTLPAFEAPKADGRRLSRTALLSVFAPNSAS